MISDKVDIMKERFREMKFQFVTEKEGWAVYYCTSTKSFYTLGRRYELIIEFNPVLLVENEKEFQKIYEGKAKEGYYDSD